MRTQNAISRAITLLLAMAVLATAGAANAGAWPREKGSGFMATAVRVAWPKDVLRGGPAAHSSQYNTFYFEYGLSPRFTIGLDLGRSVSGRNKTIAFLQMPLRNRDEGAKLSVQFGLGNVAGETVARPGVSLGWGLKNGWLSFDAVAEIGLESGETDTKLDVTWGRNLERGRKVVFQVQTGDPASDPPFVRFAPSYVFPLTDKLKLEAGGTWGVVGDDSVGLKLGLWAKF